MRIVFLFLFIFSCWIVDSFGQSGEVNQLDSSGKRDGKWIRYLDKYWKAVDDSSSAVYYRYTFYDHGVHIHPMGPSGNKRSKMETSTDTSKQKGRIKILDGEYKWYDEKGNIKFVHVFLNGEYVSYKEYYPTGELQTFFDYTKKCEGQPHSWCMFIYDKKGNITMTSFTCKDKNGRWPPMRG